jgi:hypothetical protein
MGHKARIASAAPVMLLLSLSPLRGQEAMTLDVGLDHLILATTSLTRGMEEFTRLTGVVPRRGGQHPGRGTENALVSLGPGHYLELLAPIVPAGDSASAQLTPAGWALHTRDLPGLIDRVRAAGFQLLGPIPGSRRTPDSTLLQWRTASTGGPGLEVAPFFIEWAPGTPHPSSTSPGGCRLVTMEVVAPDTTRVHDLLKAAGHSTMLRAGSPRGLRFSLDCPRGRVSFSL